MVTVLIEHFLNGEGRARFSNWIADTQSKLISYEGFISIDQLTDVQDNSRTLLELRFENLELLREWSHSDEHEKSLDKIRPHMQRKHQSQILQYA